MGKRPNHLFKKAAMAILLLLFFLIIFASPSDAQNINNAKLILKKIEEIQRQIDLLWQSYFKMVAEMPIIQEIQDKFKSDLKFGDEGAEVVALQELLSDSEIIGSNIYPEKLKTGYFGRLTDAAVRRFQKSRGIDESGVLDGPTRKILNDLYFMKTERDWMKNQKSF